MAWSTRQILTLLLLVVMLILISGLFELTGVVRLAFDDATSQSNLVTQALFLQISHAAREAGGDPLDAVRNDRRIGLLLQTATSEAPAVVFVAVSDSSGTAILHSTPARVGHPVEPLPPLPRVTGFGQACRLLASLARGPKDYAITTPLSIGGRPFVDIRVGVAGVLLRERVAAAFRRGLLAAWLQIALAVAVGFALARVTTRRLRQIEDGVAALRAGRLDARIPESGVDEFSRLARDLNLLSEQIGRERRDRDADAGSVRRTVELLGEGVLTLGPDDEVTVMNAPSARILGCDAAAARGRRLADLLPDGHPVRALAARLRQGPDETLSVRLPCRDGRPAYAAVARRIEGPHGAGGILIEFKEAAALEELHSIVDQSRILSRLGSMAAGVAHEIRNPLQTITLELGGLRGSPGVPPEEVDRRLGLALAEIQRLQRAVSGFLKVARLRQPALAPLSVNAMLAEVHESMESQANLAGLELDLDLGPDLPPARGDVDVLRQAVQNLIANAVQALPSRTGRIALRSRAEGGVIKIAVEDGGPGIPAEILPKVGEMYFTTKQAGTGVGLALVRQAIEMHGGEVSIRSAPGEGTSVTLALPVRAATGARA